MHDEALIGMVSGDDAGAVGGEHRASLADVFGLVPGLDADQPLMMRFGNAHKSSTCQGKTRGAYVDEDVRWQVGSCTVIREQPCAPASVPNKGLCVPLLGLLYF